ncbi:MAG: hypothetical protein ACD_45C00737G0006 [uncultured bacterium]|nr:MAG: hypothetical protein ACD_45C00737G0006 [uncultured bacterium]
MRSTLTLGQAEKLQYSPTPILSLEVRLEFAYQLFEKYAPEYSIHLKELILNRGNDKDEVDKKIDIRLSALTRDFLEKGKGFLFIKTYDEYVQFLKFINVIDIESNYRASLISRSSLSEAKFAKLIARCEDFSNQKYGTQQPVTPPEFAVQIAVEKFFSFFEIIKRKNLVSNSLNAIMRTFLTGTLSIDLPRDKLEFYGGGAFRFIKSYEQYAKFCNEIAKNPDIKEIEIVNNKFFYKNMLCYVSSTDKSSGQPIPPNISRNEYFHEAAHVLLKNKQVSQNKMNNDADAIAIFSATFGSQYSIPNYQAMGEFATFLQNNYFQFDIKQPLCSEDDFTEIKKNALPIILSGKTKQYSQSIAAVKSTFFQPQPTEKQQTVNTEVSAQKKEQIPFLQN